MMYIQKSEFDFPMHAVPNVAAEWQNVVNDPKLSNVWKSSKSYGYQKVIRFPKFIFKKLWKVIQKNFEQKIWILTRNLLQHRPSSSSLKSVFRYIMILDQKEIVHIGQTDQMSNSNIIKKQKFNDEFQYLKLWPKIHKAN